MSQNKRRYNPIDAVEDLWTILECPKCGMLFFSEERLYDHLKDSHNLDKFDVDCFSVELLRAIPQDEKK